MSIKENQGTDALQLEEEDDSQEGKYLTFAIGPEEYGIEIKHVTGIEGIQKITDLPDMPLFIKGVINLRGRVIPVMDIRLRFGMEERDYDDRTCIIVVHLKGSTVALIVDSVSEVIDIGDENIEPPPQIQQRAGSRFLKGLGKIDDSVKILLDVQNILLDEEIEQIAEAVKE
jgi:purine-binding chemotaxis protein CheW